MLNAKQAHSASIEFLKKEIEFLINEAIANGKFNIYIKTPPKECINHLKAHEYILEHDSGGTHINWHNPEPSN